MIGGKLGASMFLVAAAAVVVIVTLRVGSSAPDEPDGGPDSDGGAGPEAQQPLRVVTPPGVPDPKTAKTGIFQRWRVCFLNRCRKWPFWHCRCQVLPA